MLSDVNKTETDPSVDGAHDANLYHFDLPLGKHSHDINNERALSYRRTQTNMFLTLFRN